MTLFEIDEKIMDCVDLETGEIVNEEMLDALNMERGAKVENICLWIKNLKAEAEALKAEKDAFAQRQKTAENKLNSLKRYISAYLEGTPFKTARVAVSFRKTESVEIADGTVLPDEYLRFKQPEPDKAALKAALKNGAAIDGVSLVTDKSITIK